MLRNADAFLAMAVALAVIVGLAVGHPSEEVVDAATLGLLGTVALAILRSRDREVDLRALRRLAADAISDRPYEVVWQNNHWDLVERDEAIVTQTEEIRFTRLDVATNFQWSSGDGTCESSIGKWRRDARARWIPAKKIHEFPVRSGVKEIFCFDEEHSQGDMLEWCTERTFKNRFPSDHEGVELHARVKADHPRTMRITWPPDIKPTHVEMRLGKTPARMLRLARKNGRCLVEEKVPGLSVGEVVRIDWTW